jgi:LPXTG-motif cell wall-anchored protein
MDASQGYVLLGIIVLLIIALIIMIKRKNKSNRISKLTAISFAFIISGIIFGEERVIGYGLMLIGIIIAFADIYFKKKSNKKS